MSRTVVITGAFSYSGRYATRILLDRGYEVRTLTGHPPAPERPNPFGNRVTVFPYSFDRPEQFPRVFDGASTFINTYWIRFPRGTANFETAVRNSRILIGAARDAGVKRIVHVSIANPALDPGLAYYRGKAEVEQIVHESGVPYTILRPTVIFGAEDILINNMAWFLRHFPLFGIPGRGRYGIRPIYVEDLARLLADAVEVRGTAVIDAVGPEAFRFDELVRLIAQSVGKPVRLLHMPAFVAYLATTVTGWFVRDVVLTWGEYLGLMENLLASEGPTAGETRLSEWLAKNGERVGRRYASEVGRHFDN